MYPCSRSPTVEARALGARQWGFESLREYVVIGDRITVDVDWRCISFGIQIHRSMNDKGEGCHPVVYLSFYPLIFSFFYGKNPLNEEDRT